jgi:hypothetical protein
MDSSTNSVLTILALVISVGGTILGIVNHKRIVSRCCGRKADMSLDIQDTRQEAPKSPGQPQNIIV